MITTTALSSKVVSETELERVFVVRQNGTALFSIQVNFRWLVPYSLKIERIGEKSTAAHYKLTSTETAIFLLIKRALNTLACSEGFLLDGCRSPRWIKKKMHKDGHLTDESCYYVREQAVRVNGQSSRMLAVYDPDYAIRSLPEALRVEGSVTLTVCNLTSEKL